MLKGLLLSGKQLVKTVDRQSNIPFNLTNVRHIIFFYLDRIFQHNAEIFKTWTYLNALG